MQPSPPTPTRQVPSPGAHRRIGLVGCVKQKDSRARPARSLYTSTLFAGRRAYVEASCTQWWILSAAHGLVHPDEPLEPYDVTLKDAGRQGRREWTRRVLAAVDRDIAPERGDAVELHAGAEYRDFGLVKGLRARGCTVDIPTEGLGLGKQLAFYTEARRRR